MRSFVHVIFNVVRHAPNTEPDHYNPAPPRLNPQLKAAGFLFLWD